MLITADEKIPFLRGVLEPFADVRYLPHEAMTPQSVKDSDALIIRTGTRCNKSLLHGSRVSMIATATIGMDHIDTNYCESHGIHWASAPGCNAASVAQYVVSSLLRIVSGNILTLQEKTLGIIGCGHVGTAVADAATALRMKVLVHDPPRAECEGHSGFVSLEHILSNADIITLHVPLTHTGPHKTFHLANNTFFTHMRRKPFFINTSRGDVVEEAALMSAISNKKIAGAVLDVWKDEPSPNLSLLPLVQIATPHIAGYSADGKANGTSMAVQAIAKHFGFNPLLNYKPNHIPEPEHPVIQLNPKSTGAIADAVFSAYDVLYDDKLLRTNPSSFEQLRGGYRIRRNFSAFTIRSRNNLPVSIVEILSRLGFAIKP